MNLKDAYRFQNRLNSHTDEIIAIISDNTNVTKVKSTLYKSRVMPEAKDEEVDRLPTTEYADRITSLCDLAVFLMDEREKLAIAIRSAKLALEIDIDSEVGLNGKRRELADVLRSMNSLRGCERLVKNGGTAYRFNADGEQVSYFCDMKEVTTINFDRNVTRRYENALNRKSDEISAEIDKCLVMTEVDYQPPFDVNDSFSEVFESFVSKTE